MGQPRPNNRTRPDALAAAARRERALAYRVAGGRFAEIADAIRRDFEAGTLPGEMPATYDHRFAALDVRSELRAGAKAMQAAKAREDLVALTHARYERLLSRVWPLAEGADAGDPEDPEATPGAPPNLQAVVQARGILSDVRSLFGLDAPSRIDHTTKGESIAPARIEIVNTPQPPPEP